MGVSFCYDYYVFGIYVYNVYIIYIRIWVVYLQCHRVVFLCILLLHNSICLYYYLIGYT